jgi:hypothetical protein
MRRASPPTTSRAPIIYRGAPGRRPRFFGGKILDPAWFAPVQDGEFLAGLVDQSGRGKILVVDLTAHGITDFGRLSRHGWGMEPKDRVPPPTLVIAGQRMTLARWPNTNEHSPYMVYRHYVPEERAPRGYELKVQAIIDRIRLPGAVTYAKVIDPGESFAGTRDFSARGGTIQVAFDRMKHWRNPANVYIDGVLSSTWEWTYNQIASVNVEKKTITLAGPELHGVGRGESVRLPHFHFENIPEEIDAPGEYYIDRDKGLLYLYPPERFAEGPVALSTLAQPMISIRNAAHLVFDGFEFETGRGLGVRIEQCDDVVIRNCDIANFTKGGVFLSGRNIRLRDSSVRGMGGYGVHISGGDKETLEPANNEVVNCHIHDFGWDQKSQLPGVMIDGVGQRVAHCEIHDGPHFAIRIRNANDVIVEYNEIHDLPNYHKFDGGSLYVYNGQRAESRGVEIRYNYFHDIPTIGVYPDNFTWGVMIHGNVFRNVGVVAERPAVMVNGGGECRTYNNLMIDCAQMYGQGVRAKEQRWLTYWNRTLEKFGAGKVEQTPYRKYPDFKVWLAKTDPDEFFRPVSHVYNNAMFHPAVDMPRRARPNGIIDDSRTLDAHDNWATRSDPGFVDYSAGNFSLREDAPLFKRLPGFTPIPFEKMGRRPSSAAGVVDQQDVGAGNRRRSRKAVDKPTNGFEIEIGALVGKRMGQQPPMLGKRRLAARRDVVTRPDGLELASRNLRRLRIPDRNRQSRDFVIRTVGIGCVSLHK